MNIVVNYEKNIKSDCLSSFPEAILITDIIEEKTYKEFRQNFSKAIQSAQKIIPIIIDSYGGNVHSCLGMVSIIKSSPVPVLTYVETKAMSCGAIIAASGSKGLRFCSPYSKFLIHQVSSGSQGKIKDIGISLDHSKELNTELFALLDSWTSHKKGFFENLLDENGNSDLYLNPKNSLKLGLIDKIGIPKINIEVVSNFDVSI